MPGNTKVLKNRLLYATKEQWDQFKDIAKALTMKHVFTHAAKHVYEYGSENFEAAMERRFSRKKRAIALGCAADEVYLITQDESLKHMIIEYPHTNCKSTDCFEMEYGRCVVHFIPVAINVLYIFASSERLLKIDRLRQIAQKESWATDPDILEYDSNKMPLLYILDSGVSPEIAPTLRTRLISYADHRCNAAQILGQMLVNYINTNPDNPLGIRMLGSQGYYDATVAGQDVVFTYRDIPFAPYISPNYRDQVLTHHHVIISRDQYDYYILANLAVCERLGMSYDRLCKSSGLRGYGYDGTEECGYSPIPALKERQLCNYYINVFKIPLNRYVTLCLEYQLSQDQESRLKRPDNGTVATDREILNALTRLNRTLIEFNARNSTRESLAVACGTSDFTPQTIEQYNQQSETTHL